MSWHLVLDIEEGTNPMDTTSAMRRAFSDLIASSEKTADSQFAFAITPSPVVTGSGVANASTLVSHDPHVLSTKFWSTRRSLLIALDLTNLSTPQYLGCITCKHTCTMRQDVSHTTPHSDSRPVIVLALASLVFMVPLKLTLVADPDRILGILTLGRPVPDPGSDCQQVA